MSFLGTAIGLGAVGSIGGAALSASAASAARRQARDAANMPGIDIGAALEESARTAPRARELEAQRNAVSRAQLLESLGIQIPGYQEAQAARSQNALALLRGELPPDVLAQVQRKAATQAVQGGYAGSAAGRNLVARDIGRTSLDLTGLGARQFADILGTTPMAPLARYEFTPQQIADIRSQERGAKQRALMGVAGMPSATGVAGEALGSLGSGLTNLGFAQLGARGMGGGGGGGESDLVSTQRKLMGG